MGLGELYEHQELALRKLKNGKILYGDVGTGKSRVAATYYLRNEAPKDVYVITTAKKRDDFDWHDEFYQLGIGPRTGPSLPPNHGAVAGRVHHSAGSNRSRGKARSGDVASDELSAHADVQPGGGVDAGHRGTDASGNLVRVALGKVGERSDYRRAQDAGGPADLGNRGSSPDLDTKSLGSDYNPHNQQSDDHSELQVRSADVEGGDRASFDRAGSYPYVLTVDSWNNIGKYADVAGAFFIFDEQRLVGAGDWTRKFLRIAKRNTWILLSATPGDTWMDYVPVFIANGFYKNRTEFKREHVVYNTFTKFPKVDRYINVGRLARQRASLLVEMPYVRHTRRRRVEVNLPYDKETLDLVLKKRWHVYEERPLRDVGEMFLVARKVVNSDPSRLEMVKELWSQHPRLIIFYNFNFELEALRSLSSIDAQTTKSAGISTKTSQRHTNSHARVVEKESSMDLISLSLSPSTPSSGATKTGTSLASRKNKTGLKTTSPGLIVDTKNDSIAIGEWNGHKHQPVPTTDRWLYLVQYSAGSEGWNCITTDAMIKYSQTYSYKQHYQAEGRNDRLNTPFSELWYYEFRSLSFIDQAIFRSLLAKEDFNSSKYRRLFER